MEPAEMAAALALISAIIVNGPGIIVEINEAWSKVDPNGTDFQALADIADTIRPKDPLGKV
jgi:hypothetical protein